MTSTKIRSLDLSSTLRQVRDLVIKVECTVCGRKGTILRSELIRKHGASVTFAKLRRMLALGCERMVASEGDSRGTRFPCLENEVANYHKSVIADLKGVDVVSRWIANRTVMMIDVVKEATLIIFAGTSASLLTFAIGTQVQALFAWM